MIDNDINILGHDEFIAKYNNIQNVHKARVTLIKEVSSVIQLLYLNIHTFVIWTRNVKTNNKK